MLTIHLSNSYAKQAGHHIFIAKTLLKLNNGTSRTSSHGGVDSVDGRFSFEHRHQATKGMVRTWMDDRDLFLSASTELMMLQLFAAWLGGYY